MHNRILVADDEECIRSTFFEFLHSAGYQVETADSISSCIKKMQCSSFDILFLDISFGLDNGLESINALKIIQPDCKIVIITGNPQAKSLIEAKRYGATDYLAKPIHEASLLYNVRKTLTH